jgi:hypothetical protein
VIHLSLLSYNLFLKNFYMISKIYLNLLYGGFTTDNVMLPSVNNEDWEDIIKIELFLI